MDTASRVRVSPRAHDAVTEHTLLSGSVECPQMEKMPRITKVALVGLVLAAVALGLVCWLYGLGDSKVQAQERDPTIGIHCVDFDS